MKIEKLEDLTTSKTGGAGVGILLAAAATIPCAYALSYVGEGVGWCVGNVMDWIPYVRTIAPAMAERTGLIANAKDALDLNENLYQTTGAVSGFWGGFWLPWKLLIIAAAKNR